MRKAPTSVLELADLRQCDHHHHNFGGEKTPLRFLSSSLAACAVVQRLSCWVCLASFPGVNAPFDELRGCPHRPIDSRSRSRNTDNHLPSATPPHHAKNITIDPSCVFLHWSGPKTNVCGWHHAIRFCGMTSVFSSPYAGSGDKLASPSIWSARKLAEL